MNIESKETLRLFIVKAEKLSKLSFFSEISKISISSCHDLKNLKIKTEGPNSEQIDAMVLTLRLFFMGKESISFRSLASSVATDLGVSQEWKNGFSTIREELNKFLKKPSSIQIIINDESPPTNQDILFNFVYGDFSHLEKPKREVLQKWFDLLVNKAMFEHLFIDIAKVCAEYVFHLSAMCQHELENNSNASI